MPKCMVCGAFKFVNKHGLNIHFGRCHPELTRTQRRRLLEEAGA